MDGFPKEFTYGEMTASQIAARYGIDNTPTGKVLDNLKSTAHKMVEVRKVLGNKPVLVSSGYRSSLINSKVGGSKHSHHTMGYAVDFTCPGFGTPLEVAKAIEASDIKFDQLIYEFGSWVHISFAPAMRGQVLTIDLKGTRQGLD